MNGRSLGVLLLAVVLGLGAMLATRQFMSKPVAEEETQEILVAARDFKEEEILKPDMVKLMRMAKAVPPGAFSSFKDVEDRWVKTTMLEGDPIIEKKLGPKGSPPAWSPTSPRGCGPSPSTSTSNRASRASSCRAIMSTWSATSER